MGCCLHHLGLRQVLGSMGSMGRKKALLPSRPAQASTFQGQVSYGSSH